MLLQKFVWLVAGVGLFGLAACAPEIPPKPALKLDPASWSDLPGWQVDHVSAALPALIKSCATILALPEGSDLGLAGSPPDWRSLCAEATSLPVNDDQRTRIFFQTNFSVFRATDNGEAEGLFTGYYEADLKGSLQPNSRYHVPLFRRPPDLISVDLGRFRPAMMGERIAGHILGSKLVPYADRRQIEAGALSGKGLELVWVDSSADAFFLAVQGSGRVTLPDGHVMRVEYDGENGWPYVSIGRVLISRGVPAEQITMPFLRQWLEAHPQDAQGLLDENPSYIFFKKRIGEGPTGSEGVALTPERSIAVDRKFVALGLPAWIDTTDPVLPGNRLQHLFIAQDTGGAIRGPVRADIFFGYGPRAETHAGLMKGRGSWWLLLPVKAGNDLKSRADREASSIS